MSALENSKARTSALLSEFDNLSQDQKLDLYSSTGINPEAPLDELRSDIQRDYGHAHFLILRAGVGLIALKDRCEHGEFEAELRGLGIVERRAQEFMRIAVTAATVSPEVRRQMLSGVKSNSIKLASLDQETLEEAAAAGDLAKYAALPHAQLLRAIKDLHRKRTAETERADAAEFKARQLEILPPPKPTFLGETVLVRSEVAGLTQKMDLCVDSLDRVYREYLESDRSFGSRHQDQRTLAAGTFYHRLFAVHARIGLLLDQCETEFGNSVTAGKSIAFALTPEELKDIATSFRSMTVEHAGQAASRALTRGETDELGQPTKRKVGRPRKAARRG